MALVQSRPDIGRPRSIADCDRAHRLVHSYGSDTLAYFALRDDKSYFFSSDDEAMIAYTRLGHYALASGDPIGRPESIDLVIDEFLEMCHRRRWRCAFLAVRESEEARYNTFGLRSFYLGEEAVIECDEFSLDGKRNKSMRQSVGRVARTHRFEMLSESDASPTLVAQLNDLSCRWRGGSPERGFTMALSQAVQGVNPDYHLCVARGPDGVPGGFLRLVPLFGGEPGMTLDMMRRDPASPNGMTEFLIANTVFALREAGLRQLSINFAVMGRLFSAEPGLTVGQRLLKGVVSLGNPYFQIKSLHDFSRRFRPAWRPRMIAYERGLARIALLYSGVEGHLALPLIGRWFVPPPREHDRCRVHTGWSGRVPVRASTPNGSAPAVPSSLPLCGAGRFVDVTDEAVEVLEPHHVRGVTVDVELGVGDPLGDDLRVGRGYEPVLGAVGDEGGHVDVPEGVVDAPVCGEGLLGVVLAPVDRLGELEGVGCADGRGVEDLLHVRVAPGRARGREGQVEDLVEITRPERGVRTAVGLHAGRAPGCGPGEHQRAGLARVPCGERQSDLTPGRPPDDGRLWDGERVDEPRQVVGHLADGQRPGGRVAAVADAAQVVHGDLVVGGEPAGKVGAPHRRGATLPDDQDHGRSGSDLAVADRDAVGLDLPHRTEERQLATGHGAGHDVPDDGSRLDLVHADVLGRESAAGVRGADRADATRRRDEHQESYKRNQTW